MAVPQLRVLPPFLEAVTQECQGIASSPTAMGLASYFKERSAQMKEFQLLSIRYQAIVRHLPIPTFISDPDGSCEYVNPAYETMVGECIDNLRGSGWLNFVHPDDRPNVTKMWQECVASRLPYMQKHRVIRPDGGLTRILSVAIELPCKSWVGYCMPPSWANFEDPLPDLSSELDRFFYLVPDLCIVADQDGFCVRVNPAWTKVLGWTEDDLVGHHYMEFVHPDDRAATKAVADRMVQDPVLRFENRYRCKDGTYKTLSWVSTPFLHGLTYAVARDVTR